MRRFVDGRYVEMTAQEEATFLAEQSPPASTANFILTKEKAISMMPDPKLILFNSVTVYGQFRQVAEMTSSSGVLNYIQALSYAIGANITPAWMSSMRVEAAKYGVTI